MTRAQRLFTSPRTEHLWFRLAVFAVSESGTWIQITDAPDVQPLDPNQPTVDASYDDLWSQWFTSLNWAVGDTRISYAGRTWENGAVVDGGIYYVDLPVDIAQLTSPVSPTCLSLPLSDVSRYGSRVSIRHQGIAWSPDGAEVVYITWYGEVPDIGDDPGIHWLDTVTGTSKRLRISTAKTQCVRWSPTGLRVMYVDQGGIQAMDPEGGNHSVVIPADRKGFSDQTYYSPAGSHIVFRRRDSRRGTQAIRVATAEGKDVETILDPAPLSPSPYWVDE